MKRITVVLLASLSILFIINTNLFAVSGDLGGSSQNGSESLPYLIEDYYDFVTYCNDPCYWDDCVRLDCDLNLDPNLDGRVVYSRAPIAGCSSTEPDFHGLDGVPFTGTFDGNDHVIKNLTIDCPCHGGLFGYCDSNSVIKDLGLEKIRLKARRQYTGGLAGISHGDIIGCHTGGKVDGVYVVGGLIGCCQFGNVDNCWSTAQVYGCTPVGGLIGYNSSDVINCYTTGKVESSDKYIGGLIGENSGSITRCYATGEVFGANSVGGLVGRTDTTSTIDNSYAIGLVSCDGEYVGGLVGHNDQDDSIIGNCFWDVDTSEQTRGVGGEGKSTAEMKMQSTFSDAGWDFVGVWGIGERQSYPYLRKYNAADMSFDGAVNFVDMAILTENWLK